MSSQNDAAEGKPIALEGLIALNDEIASLIRAGAPLELGLRQFGEGQAGALGTISRRLSDRMSRGESLAEAVAAEGERLPVLYRRVIETGLRAGRLPAALEVLSGFARDLVDLRRRLSLALIYPFIVVLLAYALFVVFLIEMGARYRDAYESLQIPIHGLMRFFIDIGETVQIWGWIPPGSLILFAAWAIVAPDRWLLRSSGPIWPLSWLPGIKTISSNARYANFSALLALLVDHEIPLAEAVVLAAGATGDGRIESSARAVAGRLAQGQEPAATDANAGGLPPVLNWLMSRGRSPERLSEALRRAGQMYQGRAKNQIEWLNFVFPVVASVVIGGGALLLYSLAFFVPLIDMLNDLATEAM